ADKGFEFMQFDHRELVLLVPSDHSGNAVFIPGEVAQKNADFQANVSRTINNLYNDFSSNARFGGGFAATLDEAYTLVHPGVTKNDRDVYYNATMGRLGLLGPEHPTQVTGEDFKPDPAVPGITYRSADTMADFSGQRYVDFVTLGKALNVQNNMAWVMGAVDVATTTVAVVVTIAALIPVFTAPAAPAAPALATAGGEAAKKAILEPALQAAAQAAARAAAQAAARRALSGMLLKRIVYPFVAGVVISNGYNWMATGNLNGGEFLSPGETLRAGVGAIAVAGVLSGGSGLISKIIPTNTVAKFLLNPNGLAREIVGKGLRQTLIRSAIHIGQPLAWAGINTGFAEVGSRIMTNQWLTPGQAW
ncbi:hypothetical protein COX84_01945, partial [Candidatus Micrarchaeota archaeon CG_4_10_14_0_2_um_filter_49_7]